MTHALPPPSNIGTVISEAVLKLLSEGLRGKTFRFDRGFGEDSGAYLT